MRFLHTADWHLGKQLHGVSLLEEQARALEQLFVVLREEKVDALVVAGDIFDRAVPSLDALRLGNEVLSRLAKDFQKPVLLIAGNHDSAERLSFGADLFRQAHFFFAGNLQTELSIVSLSDKHGSVDFGLLPYAECAEVREAWREDAITTHEQFASCAAEQLRQSASSRKVLVAHLFVQGGKESESERSLYVGGAPQVSPGVFHDLNYVALGHLHRPQAVSSAAIRYSGSLLKYSFSEVDSEKSFSLVDISASGDCQVQYIPIEQRRDLRVIRGGFAELTEESERFGKKDDYLFVELTDQVPVIDAMARLREVYPHVLHIRRETFEGASDKARRKVMGEAISPRRSELEIFRAFMKHVTGEELDEAQVEVLSELVHEAASDKGALCAR